MKAVINPAANFVELAEISYKLRYYSKIWKENYGALNKDNMKYWEDKMDLWLLQNVTNFNKSLTTL